MQRRYMTNILASALLGAYGHWICITATQKTLAKISEAIIYELVLQCKQHEDFLRWHQKALCAFEASILVNLYLHICRICQSWRQFNRDPNLKHAVNGEINLLCFSMKWFINYSI